MTVMLRNRNASGLFCRDEGDPNAPSMGAKSLCIPTVQPAPITEETCCIYRGCKAKPKYFTLFGRSY